MFGFKDLALGLGVKGVGRITSFTSSSENHQLRQKSRSSLTSEPESIQTLPPAENVPVTLQHGFASLFGEFSGVPASVHSRSLRQSRKLLPEEAESIKALRPAQNALVSQQFAKLLKPKTLNSVIAGVGSRPARQSLEA